MHAPHTGTELRTVWGACLCKMHDTYTTRGVAYFKQWAAGGGFKGLEGTRGKSH